MADFYRNQDIRISDKELVDSYRQKWDTHQVDDAQALIDTADKESLTLKANKINPTLPLLATLQQDWYDEVIDVLSNNILIYQTWIDNLKQTRAEWQNTIAYKKNNVVFFDNITYFCIQDTPAGTPLSNTSYWVDLNLQGAQGFPTLGTNFRGVWNAGTQYGFLDTVFYGSGEYKGLYTVNTNDPITTATPDSNSQWTFTLHTHVTSVDYMNNMGDIHQADGDVFIVGSTSNSLIQYYYMNGTTAVPLDVKTEVGNVNYDPNDLYFLANTDNTMTKAIQGIWTHYNLT